MKNNTTITTRILEEFDKKYKNVGVVMYFKNKKEFTDIESPDKLRAFIKQALSRQREEIVKQLRMEKVVANPYKKGTIAKHFTLGYNEAIDEFNRKLEELNV